MAQLRAAVAKTTYMGTLRAVLTQTFLNKGFFRDLKKVYNKPPPSYKGIFKSMKMLPWGGESKWKKWSIVR